MAELGALIRFIVQTYKGIHMELSQGKTRIFGVAGVEEGDRVYVHEVGKEGEPAPPWQGIPFAVQGIPFETLFMTHLGACLPLCEEVRLVGKVERRVRSVLQLWQSEEDVPLEVMVEQFRAEVLGALRHQQQVARIPAAQELALQ